MARAPLPSLRLLALLAALAVGCSPGPVSVGDDRQATSGAGGNGGDGAQGG
ncbi:MAG: hypothetical protein ABUL62_12050 [Myxococcales bacterium]